MAMAYPERSFDPADSKQHSEQTVPEALNRLIASYTHKSYNTQLSKNLAPGVDISDDVKLPIDVKQLFHWHNGCRDPYCDEVAILPGNLRLLSYYEATEIANDELEGADEDDNWNADILPVFAIEDLELMVVVSRSTGKAAYRYTDSSLTDPEDMNWFPSLYALVKKLLVAMEEGRLCVRFKNGRPWSIDYGDNVQAGYVVPVTVDSEDDEEADKHGKQ